MKNKVLFIVLIIIFLGLIYWFFKPDHQNLTSSSSDKSDSYTESKYSQESISPNKGTPQLSASLQGTEIDCPIQVDKQGKLILTVGIRSCFDYFFSSLGEKSENELVSNIRQYLTANLSAEAAKYAIYLLDQYVAYNHALKNLTPESNFTANDFNAYQRLVNQINSFQQKFFKPEEINALFGNERNLNQFNIEQMRVYADKSLSTEQKASQISQLIEKLPESLGSGVKTAMQFQELQQLTQEIKGKGGTSEDIKNMRENLLGTEAAKRLEKVDQEEAVWGQQVNSYLNERDQILKTGMSNETKQQSVEELRKRYFGTNEEQLRAQAYETMHDQSNN
ncbi:lipase secretion chaperone [Acinetobacter sp. yr461]|uniref:lipase secretion chaperone n=1 Tax=Acinetobacter sp. yr461 TaxID=1761742 RepID=UPI0008C014B4|nr:lipase secretion chaperone [Acinetobacter sp. yr461]SEO16320.1 Lipase chaperone LimK [Acinetobacter sp. yr461]